MDNFGPFGMVFQPLDARLSVARRNLNRLLGKEKRIHVKYLGKPERIIVRVCPA
jgi:hypothetical protein